MRDRLRAWAARSLPAARIDTTDAAPLRVDARHAVYRRWARRLRDDDTLPASVRGSRFFEVAARVTGPLALGLLQRHAGLIRFLVRVGLVDPAACRYLEAINELLLAANGALLNRLLHDWRELRCPLTEAGPVLRPLAFDETMVVFEQRVVEEHLVAHPPSAAARRGIDRLLAACGNRWLRPLLRVDPVLCTAVRQGRCDGGFFAIETRIAIGQMLVRSAHTGAR